MTRKDDAVTEALFEIACLLDEKAEEIKKDAYREGTSFAHSNMEGMRAAGFRQAARIIREEASKQAKR